MKDTILDYLDQYKDTSFSELPFGEVDSLILSQFSYLKFRGLVPELDLGGKKNVGAGVKLGDLHKMAGYEDLYLDSRHEENNRKLYEKMAAGRRFSGAELLCYVDRVVPETDSQFAVLLIRPEGSAPYVAFRGTDETIIGWKEDFHMAFSGQLEGHRMAVSYLESVGALLDEPFLAGGHSKGGNFAVYAAMFCSADVGSKILCIYDHDGPGFRPEVFEAGRYERIAPRVKKSVPEESLVGMLLGNGEAFSVVASNRKGVRQHDPFSWLISGCEFTKEERCGQAALLLDRSINEWLMSLSQDEIRLLVDTLFEVIEASESDNLIDFTEHFGRNIGRMAEAIKALDPSREQAVDEIGRRLLERTVAIAKEEVARKKKQLKEEIKEEIAEWSDRERTMIGKQE